MRLQEADQRRTAGQRRGGGYRQAGKQSEVRRHDAGKSQYEGGYLCH